MGTFGALIKPK